MSTFDTAAFLDAAVDVALETTRVPCPPGDYTAQIGTGDNDMALESGTIGQGDRIGQPWKRLDVNLYVADPSGEIQSKTGRNPVIVRHGVMLDLLPTGGLDFSTGKNIRYAKLFEAAGWPTDEKKRLTPGFKASWLKGKTIKVKIGNEPNPKDPTQTFERVEAVTKAQ